MHSFYRRARQKGLWDRIQDKLVKTTRKNAGRTVEPSYALIDSQSVKTVSANKELVFDGGKNERHKTAYCYGCYGKSTMILFIAKKF